VIRTLREGELFRSPTGNIGCGASEGAVGCDVLERSWEAPRPASCDQDADSGSGLVLQSDGTADGNCANDTLVDPGLPPLAYGERVRHGSITCTSEQAGLTCVHAKTGHGFFVSQATYRLF